MKHFPAVCVDDFYEDPDYVRQLALNLTYHKTETGYYPGSRTHFLHIVAPEFFNYFCAKLFSLYYDFEKSNIDWVVETSFQLIDPLDPDKNSLKNTGWIHLDQTVVFAGIIYLNPIADIDCGTSLYKVKNIDPPDPVSAKDAKINFYKDGIDLDYDNVISQYNSEFIETVRFNNVYNRMISFDAETHHAANNFQTGSDSRLTQVFFVKSMNSDSKTPLERCRSVIFNTK